MFQKKNIKKERLKVSTKRFQHYNSNAGTISRVLCQKVLIITIYFCASILMNLSFENDTVDSFDILLKLSGKPLPGQNFFISMHFSGENVQIIGWYPTPEVGTPWKSLDPPLNSV